jgi:hypothetical protein
MIVNVIQHEMPIDDSKLADLSIASEPALTQSEIDHILRIEQLANESMNLSQSQCKIF